MNPDALAVMYSFFGSVLFLSRLGNSAMLVDVMQVVYPSGVVRVIEGWRVKGRDAALRISDCCPSPIGCAPIRRRHRAPIVLSNLTLTLFMAAQYSTLVQEQASGQHRASQRMPGRFKLLDGIELTLVVLLLLVNGSAGLHPARHQAVFFGVIHARTLSGMPTVRGHADCLQGAMRLRGGKSEWRNEVGDANEDLGELEVNLDDLGLSMGEAGEADEWMNSEYERSSGGTWVEKPMAVVDDGDETSEEEGLKKRRESPKGFETNVGRLSGGIVKTSRREEKRKERNLKQEEQEKKKKEKKKKTTKEKNEGRDLEMPSGDDDVAAAVDSDKGSKKSSKTSLRRASERLVTSKDAEPGDKVVISASIENDPDYEGGFMKR